MYLISGKINSDFNNLFEMIVDKETGALISFAEYNSSGEIIERLETLEYKVNGIIDDNIFDDLN